jgi:hypothetical protein
MEQTTRPVERELNRSRAGSKSEPNMNTVIGLGSVVKEYRLGERAMLCLWVNGQLNTAVREPHAFSNFRID